MIFTPNSAISRAHRWSRTGYRPCRGHYGDAAAFVGAGEAQHAAHVVHFHRAFQEGFGDVFCTQRIARHQYYVSEITHLSIMCGVAIIFFL